MDEWINKSRIAVVGVGATGTVLAGALLSKKPDTILVDPRQGLLDKLLEDGVKVTGSRTFQGKVQNVAARASEIRGEAPDLFILCTKTIHLESALDEIGKIFKPGTKIISTHNGLGTEDVIARRFGEDAALRMLLNYGVTPVGPGLAEMTFFNPPNHLGAVSISSQKHASQTAALISDCGLETDYVEDIKLYVWQKMVMKCTMASICAVTNRTIKDAVTFPPTREIAIGMFREALAVAKALGYDLGGEAYVKRSLEFLEKAGVHRDSMCHDIDNKSRTEIDFLGGKVVEYGLEKNVATPIYTIMTNLVRSIEHSYGAV